MAVSMEGWARGSVEGQRGVCELVLLGFLLCKFLLAVMHTRFRVGGGAGCSLGSLLPVLSSLVLFVGEACFGTLINRFEPICVRSFEDEE